MRSYRLPFLDTLAALRNVASYHWMEASLATTEEERSRDRYRRAGLTALAAVPARGLAIITAIIAVPLAVNYLGSSRYGLWIAITSVVSMLAFADLGLANGLLNSISEANGRDDVEAAKMYVSSAFFALLGVAVFLALFFALLYTPTDWAGLFNVTDRAASSEAGPSVAVLVSCFLFSVPLSVVQRVQMGYQEGFTNNLWLGFGSLLSLGGLIAAIEAHASLPWLVLAVSGGPVLATFFNSVVLFTLARPELLPRWRSVTRLATRKIVGVGLYFFVIQVAGVLAFASDNFVAARILGDSSVTVYSVTARMFFLAPMLLALVLTPLWPAYGEALARRDTSWVRKTLRRSFLLAAVVSLPWAIFLVLFGVGVEHIWVGSSITPSLSLLWGFGVWTAMNALVTPIAMFSNGASILRFQAICALFMSAGNVTLTIVLAQRIGLSGIIWGTVIAQTVFVLVPYSLYIPRFLSKLESA